ncbi:hypothetical protein L484_015240 [Morus notabilis]|uniref:Uncharacterized protein n=1 Tax=Morus notabilis TaxID=981085 RepID=W9S5B2_9ROSA|nr:hypothetical protein L484_015240 [Morus notabilis]
MSLSKQVEAYCQGGEGTLAVLPGMDRTKGLFYYIFRPFFVPAHMHESDNTPSVLWSPTSISCEEANDTSNF